MTKLRVRIGRRETHQSPFDPAGIDDPVAQHTSWAPEKPGGTNIASQMLVEASPSSLQFRATAQAWVFAGGTLLVGLWLGWLGLNDPNAFIAALIFVGAGVLLWRSLTTPFHFDRATGRFWKGKNRPPKDSTKPSGSLESIHALQILPERVRGSRSSRTYHSYELNLVLRDGSRVNVTDHGKIDLLRKDATTLSRFLGRPVWDATR